MSDQLEHQNLGIAGNVARSFVQSPLTPLLLIAALVIGGFGMLITPRQEDPQISVPMVDIFIAYPGASPEQVSALAIEPLERIMSEIPGVKHVYSMSRRGGGIVTVQFIVGEQMGPSLVKLYDKLQSNMDKIPPGVSPPLVKPKAIDDVPVAAITLWSKDVDDTSLRKLAFDILQDIKQIPKTGQGFVIGGRSEEILIQPYPARLSAYKISLAEIADSISKANDESSAGNVDLGENSYSVLAGRFLRNASEISKLVVAIRDETPVYLGDVAQVRRMPAETENLVHHYSGQSDMATQADAESAVTIAIAKKEGSNGVDVAESILERVEELKGYLIPDNVEVTITRNYGETARDKVNELFLRIFEATAAVSLLVLLALGSRPAIVVITTIPVVVLMTIFGAWLTGYTIDRVSLFALVFAIGILVDDGIVVVENIYRRWLLENNTSIATAIDAVREVGNPTILATFTVIAALLPMGFVSGMMGPYMEPIPALGSVAMLLSLVASFLFAPWLTVKLKPSIKSLRQASVKEHKQNEVIGRYYNKFMHFLLSSRFTSWATLGIILAAWLGACFLLYSKVVTVKMLPLDNKSEFNIVIDMPEGTALPITAALTSEMSESLRKQIPEIIDLQSYVGTASPFNFNGMVRHYYLRTEPWQADIQIKLLPKNERQRSSHEIALAARELLRNDAIENGAKVTVAEMPPGPPVLQAMVAEIYGPDAKTRRQFADDLLHMFEQEPTIEDSRSYVAAKHQLIRFEIDRERASRAGVSVKDITMNLAMAGGYKLGDIKQGRSLEPTYIMLKTPYADRAVPERLLQLPIMSRSGKSVPLGSLGEFTKANVDPYIYHKDLRPVEYVVGEAVGKLGAPIYGMMAIDRILENYTAPDGVKVSGEFLGPPDSSIKTGFEWAGEWTVTYETFRDMGIAFAAAILVIYILVVWEFGNFRVPLIIISPIPLTLIGIIPGHWLLNAEFTATSMIGFIALAGIIVRNSILLVDFSQQEVARGVPVDEALCRAGQIRMRPIVLTALALVAGSYFMLSDPIFKGMAISLLFGVIVATFLTLIVIPMGCISWRNAFCDLVGDGDCEEKPKTASEKAKSLIMKLVGDRKKSTYTHEDVAEQKKKAESNHTNNLQVGTSSIESRKEAKADSVDHEVKLKLETELSTKSAKSNPEPTQLADVGTETAIVDDNRSKANAATPAQIEKTAEQKLPEKAVSKKAGS
ncbi:MAG: efflux RND transporter permease subunit [bacterium]